ERPCIFTSNSGEAGAIDFFGPALGLPPAISSQNNYWLWGPRGCSFDVVVVVGSTAADVADYVGSVETAATFDCPYCMPFENKPLLVTPLAARARTSRSSSRAASKSRSTCCGRG